MKQRKIEKITSSPLHQGFLGRGHMAAFVIDGSNLPATDPFLVLADDRLDLPGGSPVGGPHPHAGFETVTLVLKGNEKDWKTGSFEIMTAGKGVIHTEEITTKTNAHILQLWLVLPPEKRWAEPFFQQLLLEDVPTIKTDKSEIRVYSGSSNGLRSPVQNNAPFTLVDFKLEKDAEATQQIPASFRGMIYVIDGALSIGDSKIEQNQAGWLDMPADASGESEIHFKATAQGARFIFYAGEPQHATVINHGPFIGDNQDDITRLYQEFRRGKMPHVNDLPEGRRVRYGKGNRAVAV